MIRTLAFVGAIVLFSGGLTMGQAQDPSATTSQSQSAASLGDAARKVRAQKKHSDKRDKVFTNDDMSRLKDTRSAHKKQSASPSATTQR